MTALDLTLPAHRSALRWACSFPDASLEWLKQGAVGAPDCPVRMAFETITTPSLAAEALRGLLEWMGVSARVENWAGECVLTWGLSDDFLEVERYPAEAWAAILALLAIPEGAPDRCERSLAALREAGR